MKKLLVVFAVLTLLFAFSVNVMAASPDLPFVTTAEEQGDDEYYEDEGNGQTDESETSEEDSYYKGSKSASPKTGDAGAPTALVFVALAAAAMSIYAARRVKEQF